MSEKPNSAQSEMISFDGFMKIKMRIGRVIEATEHPNADKLIVLKVDLGDEQRQLCAALRGHYTTLLVGELPRFPDSFSFRQAFVQQRFELAAAPDFRFENRLKDQRIRVHRPPCALLARL